MVDLQLAIQLTQIILPMIIIFGVISNSLDVVVLTRRSLRCHACSRYFLAMAINNVFYSSLVLIYQLLTVGYQMDPMIGSVILCKITIYLINWCPIISPYFIVLASIDRWCASSTNAQLRRWSDVRVANWAIAITIVTFALFYIPYLITATARLDDGYGCNVRITSTSISIYLTVDLVIYACVAPLLMFVFGLLTIYNTHQVRIAPATQNRRTEAQLARMLLLQVGTQAVLILPLCILYMMSVVSSSLEITPSYSFAVMVCALPFHLSYTTGFILYILSARVYREEFFRLFRKMTGNRVGITNNRIDPSLFVLSTVGREQH